MKKVVLSLILVFGLGLIGCSESVVLDENVDLNDIASKILVTEEKVDFQEVAYVERYVDNKVILNGDTKLYSINSDSKQVEEITGKDIFFQSDMPFQSNNNNTWGIKNVKEDNEKKEFYFVDISRNIEFRLDGLRDKISKYDCDNYKFQNLCAEPSEIPGTSQYYIYQLYNNKYNNGNEALIIDTKNEQWYYIEENNNKLEQGEYILYYFYNKYTNMLMGITNLGSVKSIDLSNKEVNIKEQGIFIDNKSKEYEICRNVSYYRNTGNHIVFSLKNNQSNNLEQILYNIKTGEVKKQDTEMYIASDITSYDMAVVVYNSRAYIGRLNEDMEFQLVYKICDLDECLDVDGVFNEEGDTLFLIKEVAKDDDYFEEISGNEICIDSNKIGYEYSFLKLEIKK